MQDDPNAGNGPASAGDVLAVFRSLGPQTRAEVMERTGLSRSTVTQRLDALLAHGLVVPAGEQRDDVPSRGRPAGQFAFHRDRGVLLVADVGASSLRVALCDLLGTVGLERSAVIDVASGPRAVLDVVDGLFRELLDASGRPAAAVHGIGLDVPGPVDFAAGTVVSPPIMTGWDRFDIRGWFAERYPCPVMVDKDVNAMAFAEHRAAHPDVDALLMLKIGTGVGSGIIAGGRVYRGADGAAGDIGHVQLDTGDGSDPPLCRCGNVGCLEAYASGWALVRDLRAAGRDVQGVDAALALAATGDPEAARFLRRAGRLLGGAVAEAVSLLNPRVVVLGGQVAASAGDQLVAGIRELVYRRSLPLATARLQIVPSALGTRAGLVGSALLLADVVFAPSRVGALLAG
ncbi:ROK family transcriptional regulator [Pseudonocardia sp. TRM90224]|uniref:ROK family transcriptional regulator n=1 Tax=Pseudonocardia sp. TRM90224 TaxID=2812678 RepID=UPI001E413858|nr:ROK family transcriptional regulator [Pseudonocardia sp. TRM90224]